MSELPELPIAYADSAPFIGAEVREPVLYPAEDHGYGADEGEALADQPEPGRRAQSRRRLASGPRAAK